MVYPNPLEGRFVTLKSIDVYDAEFSYNIRQDSTKNKYLHKVTGGVEKQREWIRQQRQREGDYFFIVYDKKGERIGTIGIYNIVGSEGEGGRTLINSDDPHSIFEASLLLSRFAFNILKLATIKAVIYAENKRAIRFNKIVSGKLFPPEKNENDELIIRAETTKDDFLLIDKKVSSIIY